jgi:hypothetical protein
MPIFILMLKLRTKAQRSLSSPNKKPNSVTKVETRLPSARIAPNPMLIAGGKA